MKTDRVVVGQILGTYKLRNTIAFKRGCDLENLVLNIIEKKKTNKIGIPLCKEHPVIGTSPDAISDDYVVDIKCPTSNKSASRGAILEPSLQSRSLAYPDTCVKSY